MHGAEVDTWDQPVNRDWSAIDGLFGGVVTVGLTNVPVTLTVPTGTPAPAPGPFQSQNRVLRFTGALSGNVTVTLPLATKYVIDNQTTGSFLLRLQAAGAGKLVSTPQGSVMSVHNDGTDCFFSDLGKPGDMEFWAGISSMPTWVAACSTPPYLLCAGSIFNFSDYPYLGPRLGAAFGGNGITTFGTPDMQGRVPLAYDGTGSRITVSGGAGFSGQIMGAAGGVQGVTLIASQIAPLAGIATAPSGLNWLLFDGNNILYATGGNIDAKPVNSGVNTATVVVNPGGGSLHGNVSPAQVSGIWVVKT